MSAGKKTTQKVWQFLVIKSVNEPDKKFTVQEVADAVGIQRVLAQVALKNLLKAGTARRESIEPTGKPGKPKALYWLAAALFVLMVAPARAQDAIDLNTAVMHGPINPATLQVSGPITHLEVTQGGPNDGLFFQSPVLSSWPVVTPSGWDGPLQYTVWACVPAAGQWQCGGFIQMWKGRGGTGAPWLQAVPDGRTNWNANWAYDSGRWGQMAEYVPHAGDEVAMFLVCGNARAGQAYETALQARTNVVKFAYPAGDRGSFDFTVAAPPPLPSSQPVGNPVQTTSSAGSIELWAQQFSNWAKAQADVQDAQIKALQAQASEILQRQELAYQDLTKQHQAQAKAPDEASSDRSGTAATMMFLVKYVAPAVGALLAGLAAGK